jgi:hypothetical protein
MKKTLFTALIFFAALRAGAESPLGLAYPLGVPELAVSGASAALGGGGTAVVDEYMGAGLNPANMAVGGRSVFSTLISYDITTIIDNDSSASVSGYMPKMLSLIIPVGRAGNLGFAMQKRYDANLNFYTRDAQTVKTPYDTTIRTTAIEVRRKGGLSAWQAGWAYRFGNGVSLGLIYERLFFNRDSRDIFESEISYKLSSGPTSYADSTHNDVTAEFASNSLRFGAQIPVHEKVTLGFAGEYPLPGQNNGTANVNGSQSKISVTPPPAMSIGAAYNMDANWLFAADAHTTLWEFYENGFEPRVVDRCFGISLGARYIPAANALSSKYWEKVHYSAGFRYATLPNDKTFDRAREYALSVGAGLPIPRDGGMVDIVVSFGNRSDPKYSGYEEGVVKLQLGLNGGRNWFQKDASKEY